MRNVYMFLYNCTSTLRNKHLVKSAVIQVSCWKSQHTNGARRSDFRYLVRAYAAPRTERLVAFVTFVLPSARLTAEIKTSLHLIRKDLIYIYRTKQKMLLQYSVF